MAGTVVLNFADTAGRAVELPFLPRRGEQYFVGTCHECDAFTVTSVTWINDVAMIHLWPEDVPDDDYEGGRAYVEDMFKRRNWPARDHEDIADEVTDSWSR